MKIQRTYTVRRCRGFGRPALLGILVLVALLVLFIFWQRAGKVPAGPAAGAAAKPEAAAKREAAASTTATPQATAPARPAAEAPVPAESVLQPMPAAPARAAAAVPPSAGLHVIFDGSGSMCGYLHAPDETQRFRRLLGRIAAWDDAEKNERVLLLRQPQVQRGKPAAGGLELAPTDLRALAGRPRDGKGRCTPFDGQRSDVERIFDGLAGLDRPDSLLLISDLVLDEGAQKRLADAFRHWYRAQPAQADVSAGILTVAMPFAGKYHTEVLRRPDGRSYVAELPLHDRPLSLVWFTTRADHAATVRSWLDEAGLAAPAVNPDVARPQLLYGVQFAPVVSRDPERWLQRGSGRLPDAPELFSGYAYRIPANPRRPQAALQSCLQTLRRDEQARLLVGVQRTCRDNAPLFGAHTTAVQLELQLDPRYGLILDETQLAPPLQAAEAGTRLQLQLQRATPVESTFALPLRPVDAALDGASLEAVDLADESCVRDTDSVAARSACMARLDRRTYGYRTLVEQLVGRGRDVRAEQVGAKASPDGVRAAQPTLRLVFDAERPRR